MAIKYRARFEAMANQLARHSRLKLLNFNLLPPATAEQIAAAEAHLGCSLDKTVRQFYSETNGLQLRWIADCNDFFKQTPVSNALMPWDYALHQLRPEEGCVFILPIEQVFAAQNHLVAPSVIADEQIKVQGKNISLSDFYHKVRLFDAFSAVCSACFFTGKNGSLSVLLADDGGRNCVDSRWTSFEHYLELLLAQKGYTQARLQRLRADNGYALPAVEKAVMKEVLDIDKWFFAQRFPFAGQAGGTSNVNSEAMQQAAQKRLLNEEEWRELSAAHLEFLRLGGGGGKWKVLALRGVSVGMYVGAEARGGKQAILDMRRIPEEWDLQEIQLPFSSWCGAYIRLQDFSAANLEGCLWADAMLEKTIFADANLQNADFSRANLRGVSFMNANLRGADFENADLSGADFRGADLMGAKFAGANLRGVVY